MIDTSCKIIDV